MPQKHKAPRGDATAEPRPLAWSFEQDPDVDWWRRTMRDAGFTQRDLSEALTPAGGNISTAISKMIRNERNLKVSEAAATAKLLNVPIDEIIRRLGFPVSKPMAPVIGTVGPDGRVIVGEIGRDKRVMAPADATPLTRALRISQRGQGLRGGYLFYEETDRVIDFAINRLVYATFWLDESVYIVCRIMSLQGRTSRICALGSNKLEYVDNLAHTTPVTWLRGP